jgi:hypothetical protein
MFHYLGEGWGERPEFRRLAREIAGFSFGLSRKLGL